MVAPALKAAYCLPARLTNGISSVLLPYTYAPHRERAVDVWRLRTCTELVKPCLAHTYA